MTSKAQSLLLEATSNLNKSVHFWRVQARFAQRVWIPWDRTMIASGSNLTLGARV